jgi:stage III sporulation protein AH
MELIMSMIIGRKQIILAALVIALGTAIFLNWKFSTGDGMQLASVVNASSNLGDTAYVNNPAVSANSTTSALKTDYFAVAKLTREQTRGDALDMIKNAANDVKASDAVKKQALTDIENLSHNIIAEGNIENLIKAKGFKNCIATINPENISIVVKPKTDADLSASDVVQIKDIVVKQLNISADKIIITQPK